MLWHLNCFYALMLITLSVCCAKRETTFDPLKSVDRTVDRSYDSVNNLPNNPPDERLDRLISFKMHMLGRPRYFSRQVRAIRKNKTLRKRYVNLSPLLNTASKTYLGNLAAATNDAYLKMQNYAATLMVVITTGTPPTSKNSGFTSEKKVTSRQTSFSKAQPAKTTQIATKGKNLVEKSNAKSSFVKRTIDDEALHYFETSVMPEMITKSKFKRDNYSESNFRSTRGAIEKHASHTKVVTTTQENEEKDNALLMADGFGSINMNKNGKIRRSILDDNKQGDENQSIQNTQINREVKLNENHEYQNTDISNKLGDEHQDAQINRVTYGIPTLKYFADNVFTTPSTSNKNINKLFDPLPNMDALLKIVPLENNNLESMPFETESSSAVTFPITTSKSTMPIASSTHTVSARLSSKLTGSSKRETTEASAHKESPYLWENNLLKGVNIKIRNPANETTVAATGSTNQPCVGAHCDKIVQDGSIVYNESAADCNREGDFEARNISGGYDIPSNDECEANKKGEGRHKTTTACTTKKIGACPGKVCDPEDVNDIEGICDECTLKPGQVPVPGNEKDDKEGKKKSKKKKIKIKHRRRRQVSASPVLYSTTPHLTIIKVANLNMPTLMAVQTIATTAPPSLSTQHIDDTTAHISTTDRIFKKSVDRNLIISVIENLKIVDQKLSEAVEPLHAAQESLEMSNRDNGCAQSSQPDNVLSDISDVERAALQRLAFKIINSGPGSNNKCKRSDSAICKQVPQIENPSTQHTDAPLETELKRLQRDLSVAEELEGIIKEIKKDTSQRIKRSNLFKLPKKHQQIRAGEDRTSFSFDPNFQLPTTNSLPNKKEISEDESLTDVHIKRKKTKKKNIWRKLFGKRDNRERFLNQDRPNSQSVANFQKGKLGPTSTF